MGDTLFPVPQRQVGVGGPGDPSPATGLSLEIEPEFPSSQPGPTLPAPPRDLQPPSTNRAGAATHHEQGPGLDLLDVPDQVLPGQEALHIHMQLVPQGHHVLVADVQPGESKNQ